MQRQAGDSHREPHLELKARLVAGDETLDNPEF
jgi:hypothetical protein